MDTEIELVSDGDGLAVFGDPKDVERFLASEGLTSKELGAARLGPLLSTGAGALQAASEMVANSGRWVQLTEGSAHLIKKHGLRKSANGLSTGVVKGKNGQVKAFVEFARSPRSLLTNPAVLSGVAGIMAQAAMQQTMAEITDYLAKIDEKVDDVLRAQTDAVLADMIGADLVIQEAMTIREHVGQVSEVTWSKVQATSMSIARTQAYALRQLDAIAEKLEGETKVSELAKGTLVAEAKVQEWLAVLARCFQLQDAMAVLELDRVLDSSSDELDRHRLALRAARQNRLDLITRSTERLMTRVVAAAGAANSMVLMHPAKAPAVVQSSNSVATALVEFQGRLGIHGGAQSTQARRWSAAAAEAKDKALEVGTEGVGAAIQLGTATVERAKAAKGKVSKGIAERVRLRRTDAEEPDDEE